MADRYAGGIRAGSTGITIPVSLRAVGSAEEVANVVAAAVEVTYWRQGGPAVPVATVALSTVDQGWVSGGWVAASNSRMPGCYRLDIPNAALAVGADFVIVYVKVAGAYAFEERINLESRNASDLYPFASRIPVNPAAVGSAMRIDTTQPLDPSYPVGTTGEALVAARAAGMGNWVFSTDGVGPFWAVKSHDDSTDLAVFTQDSQDSPTYRTRRTS